MVNWTFCDGFLLDNLSRSSRTTCNGLYCRTCSSTPGNPVLLPNATLDSKCAAVKRSNRTTLQQLNLVCHLTLFYSSVSRVR